MRGFILFLLFSVPSFAQAQFGHLLHKSYAERYLAIDTLYFNQKVPRQDSVTFFAELDRMATAAREAGDEELLLETEFLRAEYYMVGKQRNNALFLPKMLALKKLADEKKLPYLQIRTRQKLGYYYCTIVQRFGPGFENLLESYALLKQLPDEELPDKQELLANIGTAYYNFGELETAHDYFNEALKTPPSYKKRLAINMINTLGLIHNNRLRYDSAEFYYDKAYQLAQASADSTWMGIVSGNRALTYVKLKRYNEAVPLLELDIRQSLKAEEIDNAVASLVTLAEIRMIQQNPTEARRLTLQAKNLLPRTGEPFFHLKDIYKLLAEQYKVAGDLERAYAYADSSRLMNDSIYVRRRKHLLQLAESRVGLEKYRADQKQTLHDQHVKDLWTIGLIVTLALTSIIAILWINRQRNALKQNHMALKSEKETIENELDEARRQLDAFTNSIREKNQIIEQFSAELHSKTHELTEHDLEARRNTLHQLMQATLITDAQWKEFTLLFEKVHAGFLDRLRAKLPHISPTDTRYIVLTKLGLAPKEMAAMLGVRPDAIRLYKHRLRKKLDIADEESLEKVLASI